VSFVLARQAARSQKPAPCARAFAQSDVGIRDLARDRNYSTITLSIVLTKSACDVLILIIGFAPGKILLIRT
jgi:hypothetical protein